jgi:DNA primase
VKGSFHRGLEFYGQHALRSPEVSEKLKELGLIVVEGPNDVIALASLGIPAIGLCSNTITREQAERIGAWSRELGKEVTLMLDCDEAGETGATQVLPMLAEHVYVRLAWSQRMHGGRFKGRQPESLNAADWEGLKHLIRVPSNQ